MNYLITLHRNHTSLGFTGVRGNYDSASNRLELWLRKRFAFTARHRGAWKYQVDGVRSLLHGYHAHIFG